MSNKAKKCPHCQATAPRECFECHQLISKKVSICPLCGAPKIKNSKLSLYSGQSNWGIFSFFFLIISIIWLWPSYYFFFFLCSALSVVLGLIGLKYKPNGLARIGVILGLIILISASLYLGLSLSLLSLY